MDGYLTEDRATTTLMILHEYRSHRFVPFSMLRQVLIDDYEDSGVDGGIFSMIPMSTFLRRDTHAIQHEPPYTKHGRLQQQRCSVTGMG